MTFNGEEFGNKIVDLVTGYVRRQVDPLQKRIAELEESRVKVTNVQHDKDGRVVSTVSHDLDLNGLHARLKRLEQRADEKNFPYRGTHEQGKAYAKGDLLTHHGSLWVALQDTTTAPGGPSWQLCVKKGKGG
jgi:hypothetical protein